MKNFKRIAGLILVVFFAIIQLPYIPTVAEANAVQERINKNIDFMPPNPNVYDLKNEANTHEIKNKLSSLSNSTNKKSVAPMKISSVNGGKVEKILVIPIQFKDTPFLHTYSKTYFENLLLGSENSLKDYYERNSGYYKNNNRGITIAATVSDIVTSTKDMSYYGKDSNHGIDNANGDVAEMTREAINILDSKGFDFTQFDSDGDNVIDHIIIIHAGNGQEMVKDIDNSLIWSHRNVIGYPNNGDYTDGQLVDGVYAYNYLTVSETSTLGVFCHEFGHDLGLPDLYDTNGNSNGYSEGAGCWDVMASGSWNTVPGEPAGSCPANLSAWSKLHMGWATTHDITSNSSLNINNNDGNSTIYRLWPNGDKNSKEYFLAEYRRRAEYDAGLPGEGVLVWHIDKQKVSTNVIDMNEINIDDQELGVELEQADGDWDIWFANNQGDTGDPFPGTSENYNFIGASYGIKIYYGENYSYKDNAVTTKYLTYEGNTLYGANNSNIEPDKSTNVELRNISVDGANATMDCSVKVTGSPKKPTIMSPTNTTIVDTEPVFTWGVTADTKAFTLQIAENSDFTTSLQEINLDRTNGLLYTGDKFCYMPSGALENDKTYYWRVAGVNATGTGAWSDARSFTTTKEYIPGVEAPFIPTNIQSSTSPSAITITWDVVPNATGYYILADGEENYSTTNRFEQTGLAINSKHYYIVRAVNADYSSNWSEEISVRTLGAPKISVDASAIVEGAEDGGIITVSLNNGIFRTDAFYNRATVSIDSYSIPAGVKQGEVTLVDDTHLNIKLCGNSTEDYDTNLELYIDVAKELITTGRYEATTGAAIILATVEQNPTTGPKVSFSFTGENARKLVGATSDMEYSLDGGVHYLAVTVADMELTPTQLNSIDAAKNIRVRIKAGQRTSAGPVKIIDILPGPAAPNVTGDNNTDTVSGINNTMEFSTDGINWTTYNWILPDLTGNVTLRIRIPAINQTNASSITTLFFTYYSSGTQTPVGGGGVSGGGGGGVSGGGGGVFGGAVITPTVTPNAGSTTVVADNKITISTEMNADSKIVSAELKDSDLLKALEKAFVNKDGVKEVIVELKGIKDAKKYSLELPASKVSSKTKDLIIEVVTPLGTLALPNDILDSNDVQNVKSIGISISSADLSKLDGSLRKQIGIKSAIEIVMSKDEKAFSWNNPNKAITISLDYKPTAEELKDPDNLVVWYIDGKGNTQAVPNGKYDIKTGKVVFTVTHFSKYAVVYNYVKYNDLTRFKWAEKQITVMATKGVINDLADGNFNPEQSISRGMLIDYIIKALGLTASFDSNFNDVTAEDSYYESVGIAKKLGIISG